MSRRQLADWRVGMWLATVFSCDRLTGQRSTAQAQVSDPRLGRQPGLSVVGITARIGRNDVDSSGIVIDADRGLVLTSAVGEGAIWIIDARDGQLTRVGP